MDIKHFNSSSAPVTSSRLALQNLRQSALVSKPTAAVAEPSESFVGSVESTFTDSKSVTPAKNEDRAEVRRDSLIRQSLQAAGSIFSGLINYAGLTKPVAKAHKANPPEASAPVSPKFLAVLEEPMDQGMEINKKETLAYQALNASEMGKYPTLEKVFADPDAFKADLQGRFEAQKAVTPEDPYAFDFSDYGLPVMAQVETAVDKEIAELQADLAKLDGRPLSKTKIADRQVGLAYLGDLKKELAERQESGELSYRRTQELGYFAACALGHFDRDQLSVLDKVLLPIDSYLQGEDKVDIHEEHRRFQNNEFTVHQKPAPRLSGFQKVERSFEQAFFNPEKMEMVSLPTMEPLGESPFMRLLNKDIFLSGVTPDPLAADGFNRQGRLFWLHDVRHNSAIFAKKKAYTEKLGLDPAQAQKLDKRIDVWNVELTSAMKEIKDPQLAEAVNTLVFNLHHDRGLPLVPSSYDEKGLGPAKGLRLMWGMAGQDTRFDSPRETIQEGYAWLSSFWKARRSQENAIVGSGG